VPGNPWFRTIIRWWRDARRHAAHRRIDGVRDGVIVVDLSDWHNPDTATFARLIQLRRHVCRRGGDLILAGLHGKALSLYHICRLSDVLPLLDDELDEQADAQVMTVTG